MTSDNTNTSAADSRLDRDAATALVAGLVGIPSVSRDEGAASRWLVERMASLGLERTEVDEVGNAVGEIGDPECKRVIVLLGHIDTVPGDIPVRLEERDAGLILHGRGSVDAKGPLATFVSAAARLGSDWAREHDVRVVVCGAVEEEAATSLGARHVARHIPAANGSPPLACVIGEPSHAHRVTLGYKGRLLLDLEVSQPSAHTAGPDPGVGVHAIELWNLLDEIALEVNEGHERPFDQMQPSVRAIGTRSDGLADRAEATYGLRLPVGFDVRGLHRRISTWAHQRWSLDESGDATANDLPPIQLQDGDRQLSLTFRGYEPAHRDPKGTPLVRSFLRAIRRHAKDSQKPGFVVKTGTSDMNVVAPVWGCPILAYGPGDSALDHTPHEHLELDEYWQAALTLEEALRELAAVI